MNSTYQPVRAPALLKIPRAGIVPANTVWFDGPRHFGVAAEMAVEPGETLDIKLELLGLGHSIDAEVTVVSYQRLPGRRLGCIEARMSQVRPEDEDEIGNWLVWTGRRATPVPAPRLVVRDRATPAVARANPEPKATAGFLTWLPRWAR